MIEVILWRLDGGTVQHSWYQMESPVQEEVILQYRNLKFRFLAKQELHILVFFC